MTHSHAAYVACLHLDNLRTRFKGRSGLRLLEIYYHALVEAQGATGYVAEVDHVIAGYVCGIWDAASIRRKLIRGYWTSLLYWLCIQMVENPQILGDLLARFSDRSDGTPFDFNGGCELRPVVVSRAERGRGIGYQLLDKLVEDSANRGLDRVYLVTEADNLPANNLYRNFGFNLVGNYEKSQQVYLVYQLAITP